MSASQPTLHVDPYERGWIWFSLGLLVAFAAAITVAGFAMGIQLPGFEQRVDPRTVDTDPNSPWSKPGLREVVPGRKYDAYILAQIWRYSVSDQPAQKELEIPVGATVTFYVTSKDVQHGFLLQNTNLNVQVVPGHVAKLTYTFDTPGRYDFICHEYCGSGHAAMFATVVVK
jgi:cytochrome c oxidase subunit 2